MSDILSTLDPTKAAEKNDILAVDERVLVVGTRAIAIANISYIQLLQTKDIKGRRVLLFIFAIICMIAAVVLALNKSPIGVPLGIAAAFFAWRAFLLKSEFGLAITTNDGSKTALVGNDIELMKYAMDYLTWKINAADQVSRNVFNFNNSNIVGSQVGDRITNRRT